MTWKKKRRYPMPVTGRAWYGPTNGYGVTNCNFDQFTGDSQDINRDNVPASAEQLGTYAQGTGGSVISE